MKHLWKVLVAMAVILALVAIPAVATPAIAEDTDVTLTAVVTNPCFKVGLPTGMSSYDFGTVAPGTSSLGMGLLLTHGGKGCIIPLPVTVTASTSADFYSTCLEISKDGIIWVKVDGWTYSLTTTLTTFLLRVTVPPCYVANT